MRKIFQNCRYYLGDRPCVFHKKEGVECENCPHYSPFSEKIAVIKLAAPGDVLRTTSILPGLKKKYPESHLTWITRGDSLPLFVNNSFVDRVLPISPEALVCLLSENFFLAINLDTSPLSAGLLSLASAEEKKGFGLDENGRVCAVNPAAEEWLRMSVFDDIKKSNRKTYQTIIREIVGLPSPNDEIVLELRPSEIEFAREFGASRGLDPERLHIGLNTGGGGRWKFKKWTRKGTLALARRCRDELNAQLLLYGGPEEEERNGWLLSQAKDFLIDTGCHNSLREFFALLSLADILLTSDTLALHAALGLGKKTVALFGPTSAAEIELYGRGEKVITPLSCRCCYLSDCDREPNCMESITPGTVFEAVKKLL
jgi:ADP-heptose:LPS heptosyltransferase